MCGRYAASGHRDQLVEVFGIDEVVDDCSLEDPRAWTRPRWNIAPTDHVPAVLERASTAGHTRKLVGLRWGLVPSWSKDPRQGARMINARLETVAEKPSFRKPLRARRCLLPADGYYEWYAGTDGGPKQPFFIRPADQGLMVMAGIYEFWRDPDRVSDDPSAWISSCSLITTRASDDLGHIHDRMPVQVPVENWDAWLDPDLTDAQTALGLVHIPSPHQMVAHAVSRRVNKVGNEGPELVEPLPMEE